VGIGDSEAVISGRTLVEDLSESGESELDGPKIYGAQQRNMIVDARPTINAVVMQAVGKGSENMEYYPNAAKAYLGIDNIHVMRKSLATVVDALKDSDMVNYPPNPKVLASSGWLKHIDNVLKGTKLIARTVGIMHSHVLIHCSDGWDRTGQLSALSQICLDPYYRTLEGFIVLVEKDFLSFGHMFRHRSGFLGSDKWFDIENERVERKPDGSSGDNPFQNALRGARGLFNRQNESNESLSQATETNGGELQATSDTAAPSDTVPSTTPSTTKIGPAEEHRVTKVNEISPVFHQFLDATYQLLYQYPTRFEFNERFLRRLLYHLYSCQYGTFLFDNEKERFDAKATQRTRSVWDYFLCRKQEFLDPNYDPVVDDAIRGKERMIFPKDNAVRWWAEVFGRTDDDMNSPAPAYGTVTPSLTPQTSNINSPPNGRSTPIRSGATTPLSQEPIVTGTETAEQTSEGVEVKATGAGASVSPPSILPAAQEWSQQLGSNISQGLAAGIERLGVKNTSRGDSPGRSSRDGRSPGRSPVRNARQEMEVEMQ
jgi:hypothetical protein